MQQKFDLIIVGAGVVGLTLAALLKNSALSIAIIDQSSAPVLSEGVDLQQRAINLSAKQCYESLNIWHLLQPGYYSHMEVWDQNSKAVFNFSARDIGEDKLGYIVSYSALQYFLYQQLLKQKNISLFYSEKPEKYVSLLQGAKIKLSSGKILKAKIIVSAEGKKSWLREQAGMAIKMKDYQQQAIVVNVTVEKPHQNKVRQRFLSTGPLAFLPLAEAQQCAIVWSCDDNYADKLMQLNDEEFKKHLAESFEYQLGAVLKISERKAFSLASQHIEQYVKRELVFIGDAAHVIHPLAGLGLNLGIADAMALSEVLQKHQDLSRFSRKRRAQNLETQFTIDQLKQVFCSTSQLKSSLRTQGARCLEYGHSLKRFIIKKAAFFS